MPEQYDYVKVPSQGEKNPRKKIIKLGRKITDVVPNKLFGVTSDDAEYWGLKDIVTDEMADVALKMKVRKHYYFEDLLKLNKDKDAKDLQRIVDEMATIGLIEYDYGNNYDDNGPTDAPRRKRYVLPFFVPGSAEFFNSVASRIDEHPEIASFFERMTFTPLQKVTSMVRPGGNGIGMHVIPVEKAIEMNNEAVKLEKISYWLQKYDGHFSTGICSCRASRAALDEGCADDPMDWCIGVGDMADYMAETGKGRLISKEEALETLKQAEDLGYVHQITHIDGENKIFAICNCNVKICNALRTSLLFNTPNMSRSAYTAKVEPSKCVACGRCVEYCPSGAVKLGQKLCKKDGSKVEYPVSVLPDKIRWGMYAWDENYRDTARMHNSYATGSSPCKAACPAHVPVQGYLKMANQGRYEEALALIKKENPFPAICGRVCNKRCEEACTRAKLDEAVAIDAVKKFIADRDINSETRYIPNKVIPKRHGEFDEKIAIIGAGPAGLSAAYYLALLGYKPHVFEKNKKPGGMMQYGIPSYKLEKDVIDAEIEVIKALGVEIECGVQVGKDITIAELKKQGYKAFYVAIGCQGGRRPNVLNDNANGTYVAVEYLKDSYENMESLEGKNIVVIGGGNVAIDCARVSHRLNAKSVNMYSLEDLASMPASKDEIAEAKEEDVVINNSWGPKEVLVDEKNNVKGIVLKKCIRTIDPETKKFAPLYDEAETITVEADKIVFAIGQAIEWGDLLKDTKVTYWHGNYPVADKLTYQTEDPEIFVGGDVYTGPKFVIDAIAQGHEVADSIHRFVRPHASMTIGKDRRNFKPLDTDDVKFEGYDTAKRQIEGMDDSVDHKMSFKDLHNTFTEEQVKIETSRCLGCGASVVDYNKCIGCGVCTTKCEFDAIHLVRDHPECTNMRPAEKKVTGLLSYAALRGIKIIGHSFSGEARMMKKKRKAWKKKYKLTKKTQPNTGNAENA